MSEQPKSVLIPPFVVNIVELGPVESDKAYGAYYSETLQIKLRPQFATKHLHAETLFHEILHGAWDIAGLNPKDGEERIVSALSKQLCAVIQANPELVNWLMENLSAGFISSDTTMSKTSKPAAGKPRKP